MAEEEGRIVGTAECAIRDLTFDGRPCRALYEFSFTVDPAQRRKGIATRLQEAIEAYATNYASIVLILFLVGVSIGAFRILSTTIVRTVQCPKIGE